MSEQDIGLKLDAENLTYYRNIQYLKEMTRQATALLLRSNAVYEDILDDVEVTLKVKGLSDSTGDQSRTHDAACEICESYHGAPFCIVDEIDKEEKSWVDRYKPKMVSAETQWKEPRKESISDSSVGIETWRKPHKLPEMMSEKEKFEVPLKTTEPWSIKIDDHASPEEILTSYEVLCTRYGDSCGRRYLLASSLPPNPPQLSPPELSSSEKFEERLKKEFREKEIDCHPQELPVRHFLCPQYSEEVREKFETVVDAVPVCHTLDISRQKRWKDILCKPKKVEDERRIHPVIDYTHHFTDSEEQVAKRKLVVCRCGLLSCDCGGKDGCQIKTAEKKCIKLLDEENNYISTLRNRKERRKQIKMNQRKSSLTSSGSPQRRQTVPGRRRQSSTFNHLAFEETLTLLSDCIGELVDPHSDPEALEKYQKKLEELTRMASPSSMIPVREWNAWYENYERQNREETEEDVESMISDIRSSISDISDHSRRSSDLDYKEHRFPPPRIPYASETYEILNKLFEKIGLKLEKSIRKNSTISQLYSYRPVVAYFFRKLNMMRGQNDEFQKVFDVLKQNYVPLKNGIPYRILKRSKVNRVNVISRKCKRVRNRRAFIEGIQLGKRLKYHKNLNKYTEGGKYLGFSPEKRKLLRMIESKRFGSCDLVGDIAGREISKKTVHDDYRLLCNLFDESPSDLRMNLLNEDMKRRKEKKLLRDYGEPALPEPPECSSVSQLLRSGVSPSRFRKYPVKHEVTMNKGSSSNSKSEHAKYLSDHFTSIQSSSDEKPLTTQDQRARVSNRNISSRRVSQNLLLGSQKDGGPSSSRLNSATALLTNASYGEDFRSSNANGLVASTNLNTSQQVTLSSIQQSSSTRRTSKNTLSDQQRFSSSLRVPSGPDTRKLQSLSKATRGNPQVKSKVLDTPSINSSFMAPSKEFSLSNIMGENGVLTRQGQRGGSLTVEAGSRMIQESLIAEPGSKMIQGSLIAEPGSRMIQGSLIAEPGSRMIQESFVAQPGSRMIQGSLIAEPGSRMISGSLMSQTTSKVLAQRPEVNDRNCSQASVSTKEQKARPGPKKEINKEMDFLSDISLAKLRTMKPAERLAPTKKRVFGIDIGQGIHYVQYLRDNAAGADDDKKQEMLNMLMLPRETKRERAAVGKPVSSKTVLASESLVGSTHQERQVSEKPSDCSTSRKTKMSVECDISDSIVRLKSHPIKTLDEIYKEVHGINARNTPMSLIENDYEHEMMKKQQLRKHKIKP